MDIEKVRVVVRIRPKLHSETEKNFPEIARADQDHNSVSIINLKSDSQKTFTYSKIYPSSSTQSNLYEESASPITESVISGYNGTIFAYGQTGCGKTYTIIGSDSNPGIIPRAFDHLFSSISNAGSDKRFLISCSFCEIYNENLRDLLNYNSKHKLELREDKDKGIFVHGLTSRIAKNITDIHKALKDGNEFRITKETAMNEESSRSHCIFTVRVETSSDLEGRCVIRAGKLNLVDLAGSERQKKARTGGERLKEAIEINLSLSALGNVISALAEGTSSHIPYRESKLTRLLQDSLGGNTRTLMIAVISPVSYEESLSTLRYASRAKFIKNQPRINEDPKDALLRKYAEEIDRLSTLLEQKNTFIEFTSEDSSIQDTLNNLEQMLLRGGDEFEAAENQRIQAQQEFRERFMEKDRKYTTSIENSSHRNEMDYFHSENNFRNLETNERFSRRKKSRKHRENFNANPQTNDSSLKEKYKESVAEIQELKRERNGLNKLIQKKDYDISFLTQLLYTFIEPDEVSNIRTKSRFNKEKGKWEFPRDSNKLPPIKLNPNMKKRKAIDIRNYGVSPDIFNIDEASDEETDQFPKITKCNLDNMMGVAVTHPSVNNSRPTTSRAGSRNKSIR